jgi:hypothetical protein
MISADGYLRFKFAGLRQVPLVHLLSRLDEDGPASPGVAALETAITGYTEWISTETPRITLGWDWQLNLACRPFRIQRINLPRSNIMLIDAARADLGPSETAILLAALIDELAWQDQVQAEIERGYA